MISIVCVYNDQDILNKYLINSLNNQNSDYELILVDNSCGRFKSASLALNHGGKKATQKYIMFIHQDMDLVYENWLYDAENFLNSLENIGIVGVAGRVENKGWTITNIEDGISRTPVSPNSELNNPMKVQTLDECLIILPKDVFNELNFDEEVCDDWHLYAVDYSLSILKKGFDVYVLPMRAYHRSHGYSLSKGYYLTLKKLLKKHKDYDMILTTMGDWSPNYPLIIQKYYYLFKRFCRNPFF